MSESHPDLLQRFVATPYTFTLDQTRVESNSEALISALQKEAPPLHTVTHLKIIVDHTVTEDAATLTHINSGHLNTLLRGTTTVLIFDRDTRELLAFLAPQISSSELLNHLIPAVLGDRVTELQTHDIGTIAP